MIVSRQDEAQENAHDRAPHGAHDEAHALPDPASPASANAQAYLQLDGITVRFPGVLALDQVALDVRRGEVHGLMGENGAGKSTLLKVLSGVNQPVAGTLSLNGVAQQFTTTKAAIEAGIAIIYQELHLVPELTVAENLMLGALPNRFGVLDEKALLARAMRYARALRCAPRIASRKALSRSPRSRTTLTSVADGTSAASTCSMAARNRRPRKTSSRSWPSRPAMATRPSARSRAAISRR